MLFLVGMLCESLCKAHRVATRTSRVYLWGRFRHPFRHDTWLLAQNGGLGLRWHARMGAALDVDLDTAVDMPSGRLLLSWFHKRAAHLTGAEQTVAIIDMLRELISDDVEITAANFVL